MIGGFIGEGAQFPAVGISFGLETIFDAIKILRPEVDSQKSVATVYVAPISSPQMQEAIKVSDTLRQLDISVDVDYLGRKLGKNLEYASSYNIPWVIIIGEDEVKEGKLMLRDMKTGEQNKKTLEEIVQLLKK